MQIDLDREHVYRVDGVVWPGVTQVLTSAGLIDSQWFTEESRRRGQDVHLVTKLYDRGKLTEANVPEELQPYLDAWKRFLDESGWDIIAVERRVANDTYRYCGEIDRLMVANTQAAVLDIKTGSPAAWHAIQTSAYAFTQEDHYKRFCLYLGQGAYRLVEHTDRTDRDVFLGALIVHNWKERHG